MMTKRNDKRTILRIGAALAVLLFMAALFVGAGAANSFTWASDKDNTSSPSFAAGVYEVIYSGETLGNYESVTISGAVTLDFKGKPYKVETSTDMTVANRGGLFGKIVFSGSGAKLTIRNLNVTSGSASGNYGVGGLVGLAGSPTGSSGTLVFENCRISDVTVKASQHNVGGLVGCTDTASCQYTNCMVANCYIASLGSGNVGGLIADAHTARSHEAENCVVANCYIASSIDYAGGLIGYTGDYAPLISLKDCTVADCVIYAQKGSCGGIIGYDPCNSGKEHLFTGNTVRNCLIYSSNSAYGPVGGIIGEVFMSTGQTCSSNTVEYCTIVDGDDKGAGGIAGSFPAAGTLSGNKVFNTCVVSKGGAAAGICPALS